MSGASYESPRIALLTAFLCVEKFGGYSKAADYLGVTQSTITRQIASLEEWLGESLLTNNKPPKLTKFGSTFLPVARQIVASLYMSRRGLRHLPRPVDPTPQEVDLAKALWATTAAI